MFGKDWAAADHEILLCDGVPCGYVSVEKHTDHVHVRELVVLPEFQGRGIGTAFLEGVMDDAKAGQVSVRLGVLQQSRAVSFYRRLGFLEYDRTETHVMMAWNDGN